MTSDILKIKNSIAHDDSIINQQYHTYTPYTTSYNLNDEIRIAIQSQDLFVLPSESYLHIEFSMNIPENNAGFNGVLSDYFAMHFFSEFRYELNGFEIDRCKSPGITTLMKCLIACKLSDKGTYELFNLNSGSQIATGVYRMVIPLRFIFGFCDDFTKIVANSKHELILVRNRSNSNVFVANNENVAISVNKIQWKVPHVQLSDQSKLSMLKLLDRNSDIPLAYRSWDLYELPAVPQTNRHSWTVKTTTQITKPRYVVVGFQTNRNFVADRSPALFDHCNISDVKLYLNNDRYPYDNLDLNFTGYKYHELYHMFLKIQQTYYNGESAYNPVTTTFQNFLEKPIFAFDCTRTDESILNGMVDVRIEIQARENIPPNTSAYCLIIHDNLVWYSPLTGIVHRDI